MIIHISPSSDSFVRLSKSLRLSHAKARQAVRLTFSSEKKRVHGVLNVIFTSTAQIKKLNKIFLQESGLTDVIAFPYPPQKGGRESEKPFGDVYICLDVARQNARLYHETGDREVVRLIVHGCLHLLGYDDHEVKRRKKMWSRQEALVDKLMGSLDDK